MFAERSARTPLRSFKFCLLTSFRIAVMLRVSANRLNAQLRIARMFCADRRFKALGAADPRPHVINAPPKSTIGAMPKICVYNVRGSRSR